MNKALFQSFKNLFKRVTLQERSPHRVALSCAFGVYIAFCPFIFFHTILAIACSWIFGLNFIITLMLSNLVNNLWTLVPVYASGYLFGHWILHSCFGYHHSMLNPACLAPYAAYLSDKLGIESPSLGAFLLGGNLLGIVLGAIIYPIIKRLCDRYLTNNNTATV